MFPSVGSAPVILLVQPTSTTERFYKTYQSQGHCLEDICKSFERFLCRISQPLLRRIGQPVPEITYYTKDLDNFIDRQWEISVLVYTNSEYIPHCKPWIKEHLYDHLLQQIPTVPVEEPPVVEESLYLRCQQCKQEVPLTLADILGGNLAHTFKSKELQSVQECLEAYQHQQ